MAEVEIHTGHGHEIDDFGRGVGVMVGVIGIVLALATISAHRAHSAAIITRTEANDEWSFYQAKKGREHLNDVAAQLAEGLNTDPARVTAMITKFRGDRDRYVHEAEEIFDKAKAREKPSPASGNSTTPLECIRYTSPGEISSVHVFPDPLRSTVAAGNRSSVVIPEFESTKRLC
jgi:hypothetical protein